MKSSYYLSVDIGGTAMKYGLVSETGVVIEAHETSVSFDGYKTFIGEILSTIILPYYHEIKTRYENIKAIGVSATGQIDSRAGTVIGVGSGILNYLGTKISEILTEGSGLNTYVLNDANAVALAEKWIGAGKNARNMIAVTYGTGVGGGVIVNDNLLMGDFGTAGEIGHMTLYADGKLCSCGNQGCYEVYASTRALCARALEATGENLNGRELFARLDEDRIQDVYTAWLTDVAKGLTSLLHIFNPEMLVIGGGLSREKELFIDALKERVEVYAMPNFVKKLEIVQAKLTNNAGMVGAAYFAMQNESRDR